MTEVQETTTLFNPKDKLKERKIFNENIRIYFDVPFEQKDEAKAFKCWFDTNKKMWFLQCKEEDEKCFSNELNKFIEKYAVKFLHHAKFDDKDFIKANGGKWNGFSKLWYTNYTNNSLDIFT